VHTRLYLELLLQAGYYRLHCAADHHGRGGLCGHGAHLHRAPLPAEQRRQQQSGRHLRLRGT